MPLATQQPPAVDMELPSSEELGGIHDHHDFLCCLLDYIPDRIYFKDKSGRFVLVSRAEAEYLGAKDPAEVIGKSDFDYFEPALAQTSFDDEQGVMRTGTSITGKVEKKELLDGRTGWALVAKIPLRNSDGGIIGTCGISKDITKLKETEDALQNANASLAAQKTRLEQSLTELHQTHLELKAAQQQLIDFEKVQWLAHLAFGVAHEIRNPLGIVEMGIDYLSNKPAITQDEKVANMLNEMSKALQRADVVIDALMDSARSTGVEVNPRDVAEIVGQAVKTMKGSKQAQGSDEPMEPK